jgi:MFS family permease
MTETATPAGAAWRDLFAPPHAARFAFLCLGIWLNAADTLVTVTLTPTIAADIGGFRLFGWAVAAFLMGAITAGVAAGRMSAAIGLQRALVLAGALYALGCAASALATNFPVFVLGRLVQGLGAGAIAGLCYAALSMLLPNRLWVRAFAALSGVWGIATVLGPLIGGVFAELHVWRGAFWFFAVQGALFAAISIVFVGAGERGQGDGEGGEPRPAPIAQLAALALGVACIASSGGTGALWSDSALGLVGLASVGLMLRLDRCAGGVLLPRAAGDFSSAVGAGYLAIFALEAGTVAFSVYGPAFLQSRHQVSPLIAGYVITSLAAGWTIASLVVAGLHGRDGFMIKLGAVCVAVGLSLGAWAIPGGTLWAATIAMSLAGIGFGTAWSFLSKWVVLALSDEERSLGSAAIPTAQMMGGAVGAAAASAAAGVLGFTDSLSGAHAPGAGFWLFGFFAPMAWIGVLAAWRLAHVGAKLAGAERA